MTQINPNFNQYDMSQLQRQQKQPVRIPNYYYVSDSFQQHSVKEVLEENPVYQMFIKQFVEHPVAILGTWLGLGVGLDAYSSACSGKYEDSLLKKAANLGDKIQESKLIQNKPMQAVLSGVGSVKNAGCKAVKNSAILRAMKNTPSMPEWSMVKTQMFNQKQEVVQDFIRITDALKLGSAEAPTLKDIGLNKLEKDMLKKTFNVQHISQIPENEAVNQVLLNRLGRTPEQIKKIQALGEGSSFAVKQEILKEMGLDSGKLKLIKDDVYGKYINDVQTAAGKVRGKVRMGAGHYGWMGPLTKPFERTMGCDEIYNKLYSMSGGARTATGRFTSKLMQMIHRGITFGGGKLGALIFISPLLVEVAMNVKKADKDQKVGTLAGGLVESVSWVFTFPLALRMMHSLGGAQYAGMSKEQVEAVRNIKNSFNAKNKAGEFATKAEYNKALQKAKAEIKKLSTVKNQNILTKGVRKLARFLMMDLETFKGYKGSNPVMNKIRQIPNFFKNVAGVPMRFGVWSLISMGVLGAALTKCTTAIFGKSYDSMKQDERKDDRKRQKQFLKDDLNERLYAAAREKTVPVQNIKPAGKQAYASRGVNQYSNLTPQVEKANNVDNYTYIPSQENVIPQPLKQGKTDNYTYIPSQECTIKSDKVNENQRRYIPSQAAANINKNFDNSGLQSALDRAQRAEDKALRVLAGNFDGME